MTDKGCSKQWIDDNLRVAASKIGIDYGHRSHLLPKKAPKTVCSKITTKCLRDLITLRLYEGQSSFTHRLMTNLNGHN